jgi:hypothetical protein
MLPAKPGEKSMEMIGMLKAENAILKNLARTALQLIKAHLQTATDDAANMD